MIFQLNSNIIKKTWIIIGIRINKPSRTRDLIAVFIFTEHGEISGCNMIAHNVIYLFTNIKSSLAKTIGTTSVDNADFLPAGQNNLAVFEQTDNQEILNVINSFNNTRLIVRQMTMFLL